MTARSVVLSVLLGAHPAWATPGELIRLTADFGINDNALRVALTRMVAAGDLIRSADGYRLSDRLLARQRRQDEALAPTVQAWDRSWNTLVITSVGSAARERSAQRKVLLQARFGELREGVWLRPANVELDLPGEVAGRVRVLRSYDDAPADLAGQLWDLPGWAAAGRRLLDEMAAADGVPGRFVAAAAMVRHLLTDPLLPVELLPEDWPGDELRSSYATFATELADRRDHMEVEA